MSFTGFLDLFTNLNKINMDPATVLILLALVMLIGSFLAGSIPLVVNFSEEKLHLVSIFGAGMLVGTALNVIIPEGCRALYSTVKEKADSKTSPVDHDDLHKIVGMSLLFGFLVMLFVDRISHSSRSDLESGVKGNGHGVTATIGLVFHSAADGIALGAAASTSHNDVEMIVFLAIMLHKAPAAFGLVTFLLHEGLERNRIRKHLGVFSVAAPLFSLITFFGLGENKEPLSLLTGAGTVLLFSAGTFLYVATVHVLPELISKSVNNSNNTSHSVGVLKKRELFAIVVGALLPSILTMGHHH